MNHLVIYGQKPTPADIAVGRRREKQILAELPIQANRKAIEATSARTPHKVREVTHAAMEKRINNMVNYAKFSGNADNAAAVEKWGKEVIESLHNDDLRKERNELVAASRGRQAGAGRARAVHLRSGQPHDPRHPALGPIL